MGMPKLLPVFIFQFELVVNVSLLELNGFFWNYLSVLYDLQVLFAAGSDERNGHTQLHEDFLEACF